MNISNKTSFTFFVKLLCNIAVSAIFIWLFIRFYKEIIAGFSNVSYGWALSGCAFYALNYFFRVSRMMEMVNIRRPSAKFVYLVFFHGFATYMLPLQSGDFLLPFILNHTSDKNFKEGFAILFILRILDIFAIGILISVSFMFFNTGLSLFLSLLWGGAGIIMLLVPLMVKYFGVHLIRMAKVTDFFISYIVESLDSAKGVFRSVLIWCSITVCIYCAIRATGLDIGLSQVVFITSIQMPFQVLPIQGVANTGAHEGSWVLALTAIGFSSKEALLISITTHALIVSYVLLIGLIGLILYFINIFFVDNNN